MKLLLFLLIAAIQIQSQAFNCSEGLELFSVGCTSAADCADANGHTVECRTGICTCPESSNCTASFDPIHAAQYESCIDKSCLDGHGVSSHSGQRENSCAQRLKCFGKTVASNADPVAICLTCSTCLLQNDGAFNCSSQCTREELEVELDEIEESEESSTDNERESTSTASSYSQATLLLFIIIEVAIYH